MRAIPIGRRVRTGLAAAAAATAVLTAAAACLPSQPAHAAAGLAGESMGWPWVLPFIGMLLSIATGPLLFSNIWHRMQTGLVAVLLLTTFLAIDFWRHRNDVPAQDKSPATPMRLHGVINIVLIGLVVVSILISAAWKPGGKLRHLWNQTRTPKSPTRRKPRGHCGAVTVADA